MRSKFSKTNQELSFYQFTEKLCQTKSPHLLDVLLLTVINSYTISDSEAQVKGFAAPLGFGGYAAPYAYGAYHGALAHPAVAQPAVYGHGFHGAYWG